MIIQIIRTVFSLAGCEPDGHSSFSSGSVGLACWPVRLQSSCRHLGASCFLMGNWWEFGPLYQIGDVEAFVGPSRLKVNYHISVVLDLTPNYKGSMLWFSSTSVTNVAEKVKVATDYWLAKGVDGILLYGVDRVATVVPSIWDSIREIVSNHTKEKKKKVLIGATKTTPSDEVNKLLNGTGVDLLLSNVLRYKYGAEFGQVVQNLYSQKQTRLAWNLGH
ncbi:hypothetical protein QTP86_029030 [Hemibagrus guttatus]|nr:hypothetical protein QTP86_029030 [Hemibagrus guttatus]